MCILILKTFIVLTQKKSLYLIANCYEVVTVYYCGHFNSTGDFNAAWLL